MELSWTIPVLTQHLSIITILVCNFAIKFSESGSYDYDISTSYADSALEDLLEKYENIDHQDFWHPNSFNTGLQSREVIKITSVSAQYIPGVYKQWKSTHLGPGTIFAGLGVHSVTLFDENFNQVTVISTTEQLVALAMFSSWNEDLYMSECVIIVATLDASLHSYSFVNNTVVQLGSWPLHQYVKSLELCTVELTQKIVVIPQDPRGSVDIYNFQVDGNSAQLWFFQSLKLAQRTCLVVHDVEHSCSIAYATGNGIGSVTYDPQRKFFQEQSLMKNVSNSCKQMASFHVAYSPYLAYVPDGVNHTVQFFSDLGKGQLFQKSAPIQALEVLPLPASDYREDILLVLSPESHIKLYSYDGYGKLFKETFPCPPEICSLGQDISKGGSALANGTTTVFIAPTQSGETFAKVLVIQSTIEEYPSPLLERARQHYKDFQGLADLYKRFQQTIMITLAALDDAIDPKGANIINGNWSVEELSSYEFLFNEENPSDYKSFQKDRLGVHVSKIEFNGIPLNAEDFSIKDEELSNRLEHLENIVQQGQVDAEQTVPLNSSQVYEVSQPQYIEGSVSASNIETNNLQIRAINDVDRPDKFFNGLAQQGNSLTNHHNRNISFQGHLESNNINSNYVNGVPVKYMTFSSADNDFNTYIAFEGDVFLWKDITTDKVSRLRIPQDIILVSNMTGVAFTGTLIAPDVTTESTFGGIIIDDEFERNIFLNDAVQNISSTTTFESVVLRSLSSIKYLNGRNLTAVIESIVSKNHQGRIRGAKRILSSDTTANSLTIRETLNSIPFPDGYVRKSETDLILYGVKSFSNITADKVVVEGYINGVRPDQIVKLDSSGRSNDRANWTLKGQVVLHGDTSARRDVGGIPAYQWALEDPSRFVHHHLFYPNRFVVIENPVEVDVLEAKRNVNGESFNETFGDVLVCEDNQPLVIKGVTAFQNGVILGALVVQTNEVNGTNIDAFLHRHKEQVITKNFVFKNTVAFWQLFLLGFISGHSVEETFKDVMFRDSITWPPTLKFDSIHAESGIIATGPINDFSNFGSDVAVKRGRVSQSFENRLFVKYLKVGSLEAENFETPGRINGLNIDQWAKERVTLSQDQTWSSPVELGKETVFMSNIHSKSINGESFQFLQNGVLRTDTPLQTFSGPVVINGLILARGNVNIHDLLDGYSFADIKRDSIPVDSNNLENIATAWKLEKAIFDNLIVKGKTCGVDLASLDLDSVRQNDAVVHFQGRTFFEEDMDISAKLRTNLVNSINLNESFFTLHTPQEVKGNFHWKQGVEVQGEFNVHGKINGVSLEDIRRLYSFYNNTHYINSSVEFENSFNAKHLKIDGFIQSRNFTKFLSSIVKLNAPRVQDIHGDLKFTQPFVSEADIECDTLNGIDVSELSLQLLRKNDGSVLNQQVCFKETVQTDAFVMESRNLETIDGTVGGVNLDELKQNSIPLDSVNLLSMNKMSFESLDIQGSLKGVRFINGIPIEDFLTRNTAQNIQSVKVTNLSILQTNIDVLGHFGGVRVTDAYQDTLLKSNQVDLITGAKTFTGHVRIDGNLNTDGKLIQSLVWMDGENIITSKVLFEDDVIVMADMNIEGKWNNYTLNSIQEHGVSRYNDEVIKTRWNFTRGLVLTNVTETYGRIDGINLTYLHEDGRERVNEAQYILYEEQEEFQQLCGTYQHLLNKTAKSPLKLQSFDEQQVIFTQQKVTNILTAEVGSSLFLFVTSDVCGVYVYKWSTQKEEFHDFTFALTDESIDKWVQASSDASVIITFSTMPSKCGKNTEVALYFTIVNTKGIFSPKQLIESGTIVDYKLVSDKLKGILLFAVYAETPETVVVYSWNGHEFILETSLNISSLIRTLNVNKLSDGDVEILIQTVFRVSVAIYSSSAKSLTQVGRAEFYGSSKSMALFRADKSLYALVAARETKSTAIKPDYNLQLFLSARGELQFLQKLKIYDLVSMEVVRMGNQVYVFVLTRPVGLYIYRFMGLSGLQSVNHHPLKFHRGEHLASFSVTPWHYDTPLPFVLISSGNMIKLFHSNVIGNAVWGSDKNDYKRICSDSPL